MGDENALLRVEIGPDRIKPFQDVEEVADWYKSEREAFEWLTTLDVRSRHNKVAQVKKSVSQNYNQLSSAISDARSASDEDRKQQISRLANQFNLLYGRRKLIASETPEGKYVEKIRQGQGPKQAALIYGYLSDVLNDPNATEIRAAFDALLFRKGIDDRAESEREALSELHDNWTDRFAQLHKSRKEEMDKIIEQGRSTVSEIDDSREKVLGQLNDQKSDQQEQFGELLTEAKAKLDKTTELYKDQIALSAPVEYWKNKAYWHGIGAAVWGVITIIAGWLIANFFVIEAEQILGQGQDPNYAQLITLLTIATLGVWGLRLLVRLLFSQIHLRTDARERSVMLQAFLALLREGHVGDQEKDAILATLFRPASTGVVKEDSAPPSLAEFFSRFGSR